MQVVRTCARCGAIEQSERRLMTVGELLDAAVPLDLQDARSGLWHQAFCVARDCLGAAARAYVGARLDALRPGRRRVRRIERIGAR